MQRCQNCLKQLPQQKMGTHFGYCRRNIKKCPQCGELYDINYKNQHEEQFHKKETCKFCKKDFQPKEIEKHKIACSRLTKFCQYCQLNVPVNEYSSHLKACQSRTKNCQKCYRPITNKDYLVHIVSCKGREQTKGEKQKIAGYDKYVKEQRVKDERDKMKGKTEGIDYRVQDKKIDPIRNDPIHNYSNQPPTYPINQNNQNNVPQSSRNQNRNQPQQLPPNFYQQQQQPTTHNGKSYSNSHGYVPSSNSNSYSNPNVIPINNNIGAGSMKKLQYQNSNQAPLGQKNQQYTSKNENKKQGPQIPLPRKMQQPERQQQRQPDRQQQRNQLQMKFNQHQVYGGHNDQRNQQIIPNQRKANQQHYQNQYKEDQKRKNEVKYQKQKEYGNHQQFGGYNKKQANGMDNFDENEQMQRAIMQSMQQDNKIKAKAKNFPNYPQSSEAMKQEVEKQRAILEDVQKHQKMQGRK